MNPRLALVIVIGLAVVLTFVVVMAQMRRARREELLSSQRYRIGQYQTLVNEIHDIARNALDVDPSAALIDIQITKFKQRELS
jgi:hypothetical protein